MGMNKYILVFIPRTEYTLDEFDSISHCLMIGELGVLSRGMISDSKR